MSKVSLFSANCTQGGWQYDITISAPVDIENEKIVMSLEVLQNHQVRLVKVVAAMQSMEDMDRLYRTNTDEYLQIVRSY